MTYEERKRWLCQQCGKPHQCGYISRGLQDDCTALQEWMQGWELGHADAIEEACKFFEARMWEMRAPDDNYIVIDGYAQSKKDFIEQFKKIHKRTSMTREEQIVKASRDAEKQMGLPIGASCYGIGYLDGALWADEHPTEEVQRLKEMFKGDPDAYKQGRKDAVNNPTGGELLHVLNKGRKIGYNEATERAVEFIYAQNLVVQNIEELINELKKYMEEEQQ